MATSTYSNPLIAAALASAVVATGLLVWFLVRRPTLTRATKIVLLLGIGVLPLFTAGTGNVVGYEATKARTFCGSCHVMTPYLDDALSPDSLSLAARHNRNEHFGPESCYVCHADYGMFGTVTTKLGGMRHVYLYLFEFRAYSFEEALPKINIAKPFSNDTCMRCHSTAVPSWQDVADHGSLLKEIRNDTVSCASEGCHGPPHAVGKKRAP
jgi:nitrate/TMAO reductase-like tetraheme cytochrome c subunit